MSTTGSVFFGEQYGLTVKSEPDEGTTVTIHIPAIPFTEENRVALESGKLPGNAGGAGFADGNFRARSRKRVYKSR